MHIYIRTIVAILTTALLFSCSTSIERLNHKEVRDLSGSWNDTDSRLVSEEVTQDLLSKPWYSRFQGAFDKDPTIVVGTIKNLSHEHINTKTFISDIERALINSGKVSFVANSDFRDQIRQERAEQDLNASAETRKETGQEIGADYMLVGTISTIIDKEGSNQVRFYQIDLRLIDIKTTRIMWTGQKKIKKYIEEGSFR